MTGPMREVGWGFQAVRLADGRVLIAGGMSVEGNGDTLLGSTEIFDPLNRDVLELRVDVGASQHRLADHATGRTRLGGGMDEPIPATWP